MSERPESAPPRGVLPRGSASAARAGGSDALSERSARAVQHLADRRSSRRWLRASAALCLLLWIGAWITWPFVTDPQPASWLSPAYDEGTYVRKSLALHIIWPTLSTLALLVGYALAAWIPLTRDRLVPLPARATFLVGAMFGNVGMLAWTRPGHFSAWIALVYVALLLGLVFNWARVSLVSRPRWLWFASTPSLTQNPVPLPSGDTPDRPRSSA